MRTAALSLAVVLLALAPASAHAQDVIVRYRAGTDATERAEARRGADVRRESSLPLPNTELVDPESGVSAREAIAALNRDDDVLYAEIDAKRRAFATPDDTFFAQQWGLRNTGQSVRGKTGTPGADVRATEAWDVTTGSAGVLVAVADTGVDLDHPDLAPNLYRNAREADGVPSVDDDGNGFVDDLGGWDFVNGDATAQDGDGHGTHVTGTVGARGNDATGVTGVAWEVDLLPLQVLGATGEGTVSDAIKAYRYAARAGARVINLSLGGDQFSRAERDALAESPNMLVVAAAGNEGLDTDIALSYPCEYDLSHVVCVAASDQDDNLASFSNYGASSVDLAAPGTSIASTALGSEPSWVYMDGTSMAAPFVTGAAALWLSRNPRGTATELRTALLSTAERLPGLAGRVASGGRLDVAALLGPPPPPPPPPPAAEPAPAPAPAPPPPPPPALTPTPTPTPAPAPAPTPAPVLADGTAPFLTGISLTPRRDLRSAVRRGIRLRLRCSERCNVRIDLLRGRTRIARRALRAGAAGSLGATLRPSAAAARRLRSARSVVLTVRVRATDPSGNARTITRRLRLRRS